MGFGGSGTNLYAYASDSPTNFVDPFGLASCVYSISAHVLICVSDTSQSPETILLGPDGMSSGQGTCANNLACINNTYNQNDPNSGGPIPPGWYQMTFMHQYDSAERFDLAELPRDIFSRALRAMLGRRRGFQMHRGTITHGCVNADKNNPDLMDQWDQLVELLLSEQNTSGNILHVTP